MEDTENTRDTQKKEEVSALLGVEHFPVLVVTVSLLSAYTILVAGWFNRKACFPISLATVLFQFALAVLILHHVLTAGPIKYRLGGWAAPWGIVYVVDALNAFVLVAILFVSVLCVIYGWKNVEKEIEARKIVSFYVILQLLITGLCGIVVTGDMFNLYVFLEIASLTGYALIAAAGGRALRASFNYLIMGSIGACFYLLGVGFLYAVTGSLNMLDIQHILPPLYENKMVQAAFVFIFVGFSIKMALFPLHLWQPDAYTYAPSTVSALIAATMSKVSVYALIRVIFTVFTVDFIRHYAGLDVIICWIAAIGIIMGSIFAIAQRNIKRMLAYSSISQIGYIMLGVGLAPLSVWGLVGAVAHILNHAIMKCCLFMSVGGFFHRLKLLDIRYFYGLGKKMPWTSAFFTIAALSMIGVPPTTGFASKIFLLIASAEASKSMSSGYAFIAILLFSSLLNLVYFWRVIERMYFVEHEHEIAAESAPEGFVPSASSASASVTKGDGIPRAMLFSMLVLASACILVGILWLTPLPATLVSELLARFGLPQPPEFMSVATALSSVGGGV